MNDRRPSTDPLDELRYALAEGNAQRPSAALADAVMAAALNARSAGRPVDDPEPISPVEALAQASASLDSLLGSLRPAEWRRPCIRALSVQGLVGHLIGVERDFQAALGAPEGHEARADHVASTDPVAQEHSGRPPAETLDAWRASVATTARLLAEVPSSGADGEHPVALYGLRLELGPFLVVRTFELWTHEEDIRRATGRHLRAPGAATLALMTSLAVTLLPAALARTERSGEGLSARIVLTGPGGGTWQRGLGPPSAAGGPAAVVNEGPVDVRIVVDAVEFCRLVANRVDPGTLAAVVTGDAALARDLFVGAAGLALD
ncbi:MAG TPA: maleylpyruvate isomerase family mycothiol-dependent enzyme [Acidimicrobiales bacterium]|nr:maleylpyruvate isomerase family mycothiol-dependent enzyme [Acidimicrobiales bacterium]